MSKYKVKMYICGIGEVTITIHSAKNPDEAADCAMEMACSIKHNDIEIQDVERLSSADE